MRTDLTARRTRRIAVLGMLLVLVAPAAPAQALDHSWKWAKRYTDVSAANRTWQHRTPSVATGNKSAYELSAKRNRKDHSRGRAAAARKSTFEALQANGVHVQFFGKVRESDNDPMPRLKVYVHCVGELEDEWVYMGRRKVKPSTASELLKRTITAEDCETQTVDGVMVQLVTGERGDRRRRTVFLEKAELWFGGAVIWNEDFTTP